MSWRVIRSDCVEAMKGMDDCSVDSVVCDPPYGLEFMGKAWDRLGDIGKTSHVGVTASSGSKDPSMSAAFGRLGGVTHSGSANRRCQRCQRWEYSGNACECGTDAIWPNVGAHEARLMQDWHKAWATEALRVLKPGGHLLAFGGTRTYHRLACAVEDAGFEIRDTISWMYGSGFPKSLDVSKQIDKRREDDPRPVCRFLAAHLGKRRITDIVQAFGFAGNGDHGVSAWFREDHVSPRVPTWDQWNHLRDLLEFGSEMDAEVWRLNGRKGQPGDAWSEREIVGTQTHGRSGGQDFAKVVGSAATPRDEDVTLPATPEAERWQGWGTALKPAHEPIVVARKPLSGTVAETVTIYGTGALNIDGCRVGTSKEIPASASGGERPLYGKGWTGQPEEASGMDANVGRWPANVVLDEEAGRLLDEQTGELGQSAGGGRGTSTSWEGGPVGAVAEPQGFGDSGGASRFFYCAKASRAERNAGLEGFEDQLVQSGMAGDMPTDDQGRDRDRFKTVARNVHPTVKPIELMRWLVRLVTPPGGKVLDPFTGSGTTGCAAVLEGFDFVGIEREPEYADIAEARIHWWEKYRGDGLAAQVLAAGSERDAVEATGQLSLDGEAA